MQNALADSSRAFDAHALHYDALVEPNALLQTMRAALWSEVTRRVPPPAHLLDIGCGTGTDAVYFSQRGYTVTAIDASREMVNQTRQRMTRNSVQLRMENMGAENLSALGNEKFDAIYSDLGPLNCVEDLAAVSAQCAARLKPNGFLIFSVMARLCPWEILYYILRGDWKQTKRRFPRQMVPVNLENGVVWTRYYDPSEFYAAFAQDFQLVTYRSLNLFLPPPYLLRWYQRLGILGKLLAWLDAKLDALPLLRNIGDHFLITLTPRREIGVSRA